MKLEVPAGKDDNRNPRIPSTTASGTNKVGLIKCSKTVRILQVSSNIFVDTSCRRKQNIRLCLQACAQKNLKPSRATQSNDASNSREEGLNLFLDGIPGTAALGARCPCHVGTHQSRGIPQRRTVQVSNGRHRQRRVEVKVKVKVRRGERRVIVDMQMGRGIATTKRAIQSAPQSQRVDPSAPPKHSGAIAEACPREREREWGRNAGRMRLGSRCSAIGPAQNKHANIQTR